MNQDVHYTGYSANPSDYECQDGELAISLNLINEDGGSVKALPDVEKIEGDKSVKGDIVFVHKVSEQENLIIRYRAEDSDVISWIDKDCYTNGKSKGTFIIEGFKSVVAVGNTLVFSTDEGLHYLLWKDDDYINLGTKPPFVTIEWGLCLVDTLSGETTSEISKKCSPSWLSGPTTPHIVVRAEDSDLEQMTQAVYGLLNSSVMERVVKKGCFHQPFFVRYAYRLFDGSYAWHSAPVLMLASTVPPIIKYAAEEKGSTDDVVNATFRLSVPYFNLVHRIIKGHYHSDLGKWKDIIHGIDVFVSAPIYTYDQSKRLDLPPTASSRDILLDCCNYNANGWDLRDDRVKTPSQVLTGHYASTISSEYKDHAMPTTGDGLFTCVNIRRREGFSKDISQANIFYKIAELKLADIINSTSGDMTPLELLDMDLSSLVTKQTLEDDYQTHCVHVPDSMYVFNSRLNIAGGIIYPARPYPFRSCVQLSDPNDGTTSEFTKITVWTRINGTKCQAVLHDTLSNEGCFFGALTDFPRYIYYPDSSAYQMDIELTSGKSYSIPLTPHDFLNGAYYLNSDFMLNHTPPEMPNKEMAANNFFVSTACKLYQSEINNPFFFPVTGINTVGTGKILNIATAAKALSQGQFGQFPLYAFTDEGVWAMEVSGTGTYSAKQPITRDVCINPEGITQIDSAVLFPTNRGIMLISGSQTECISDVLNTATPFDIATLPGMNELHAMLGDGHELDNCIPTVPFLTFLKDCRMIYDYVHQRIIVYNENYTYAYVYSLKSKLWGMMYSDIKSNLNSYPNALAVTKDGKLVDFSLDTDKTQPGLLLTRPLKLGGADVMKTIDTVIQRGNFQRGHVKAVLYGSRNLKDWNLVWSSKDHYLRGFRGTPYKYFRIALLCNLDPGESVFGASVQFTPRLTGKPR